MLTPLFLVFFLYSVDAQLGGCQTPDKQTGFCIPLPTCKTIFDYVTKLPKPVPPEVRQKLRAYQCGVSGNKPKVCCPPKPVNFGESEASELDTFDFPDVSNHPNLRLLPKDCGHLDLFKKVVNGNRTSLLEFPWMALLSYQTSSGPDFRCGGTILNDRYILTAAHCVTNLEKSNLKLIGVRVGEWDIGTTRDCEVENGDEICSPPVQDLGVEDVLFHPKYSKSSHVNDIAVIRVSQMDLAKENVRPVCLPLENTGNFNYTNRRVVVTGWGYTENGSPSKVLLKAELEVSPRKECQEKYMRYKLAETQMCAGGKGGPKAADSCGGDSGGPLHSLEALHDQPRYIQQGIVSFGPADCGKVALPGVYTRVAFYVPWILDNLKP